MNEGYGRCGMLGREDGGRYVEVVDANVNVDVIVDFGEGRKMGEYCDWKGWPERINKLVKFHDGLILHHPVLGIMYYHCRYCV